MPEFLCTAVLFDLDGVLVDSTESVIQVWTAWSKQNGIAPAETLAIIHGRRTMEALQLLAPHLDIKSEAEKIEAGITYKKGTVAIPGAASLLKSLPVDRWCVVTSGLRKFANDRLQAAGLPLPRFLITADDVTNGKPHPEPYLKGGQLVGFKPSECIVVEDALNGIRAGKAAGMRVIGVATTYPPAELREADIVAKTLEEVTATAEDGLITIRVEEP